MIHFYIELFCARFCARDSIWTEIASCVKVSRALSLSYTGLLSICECMVTRTLITAPATVVKLQHGFKVVTVTRDGGCNVRQQSGSLARKI